MLSIQGEAHNAIRENHVGLLASLLYILDDPYKRSRSFLSISLVEE